MIEVTNFTTSIFLTFEAFRSDEALYQANAFGSGYASDETKDAVGSLFERLKKHCGEIYSIHVWPYRIGSEENLSIDFKDSNNTSLSLTISVSGKTALPFNLALHEDRFDFFDWVDAFYFVAALRAHFNLKEQTTPLDRFHFELGMSTR